jgi:hypothetical protein
VPGGISQPNPNFLFSYRAPVITDIRETATGNSLLLSGFPTEGDAITVVGSNLGGAAIFGSASKFLEPSRH